MGQANHRIVGGALLLTRVGLACGFSVCVCVDVRLVFVCECRQKGDVDNEVS